MKRAPSQQSFALRSHGGARRGAGRKRTLPGRPRVPHRTRTATHRRFPLHVTVRLRPDAARLRNFATCAVLRQAFVHGCDKGNFRICQFSIQSNHIHHICEAVSNAALARGMQGWSIRVARGLNRHRKRTGSVFADRYHVEIVRTAKQCQAALRYVLLNANRHGAILDRAFHGIDPFSSAWWFDGWRDHGWRSGLAPPGAKPVRDPHTWLLASGWRRHGLLVLDDVPSGAD